MLVVFVWCVCLDVLRFWAQERKRYAADLELMEKEASETAEPGFRFLLVLVAHCFRPQSRRRKPRGER